MNPISYARHVTILSSGALAKKIGISRQYINRCEQGLYPEPNKKLLLWTAEVLSKEADRPVTDKIILNSYRKWQWEHRRGSVDRLSLRPCVVTDLDKVRQTGEANPHPSKLYFHKFFKNWREGYWNSYHSFSVDMCLHPDPITLYEEGSSTKMPNQLRDVMLELDLLGEGFVVSEK